MQSPLANNLTLDVGELLCHFSIPHAENIDAADVSTLAVLLSPPIQPANHAAVTTREDILGLESGLGRRDKETLPEGTHGGLSLITLAIWRWVCIFEDTVLCHSRRYGVYIVSIEDVVEALNHFKRVFGSPIVIRSVSHGALASVFSVITGSLIHLLYTLGGAALAWSHPPHCKQNSNGLPTQLRLGR